MSTLLDVPAAATVVAVFAAIVAEFCGRRQGPDGLHFDQGLCWIKQRALEMWKAGG